MGTTQVKNLSTKEDLANLVGGDIVRFGCHQEEALCYDYPGLRERELFFISRLPWTCPDGSIGIIFEHIDNLKVKDGCFNISPFDPPGARRLTDAGVEALLKKGLSLEEIGKLCEGELPGTQDGLFHYGVGLVMQKAEDPRDGEYVNPEKYREFDKVLRGAGR